MKTTLYFFSATDTTRKILRAIGKGTGFSVSEADYTLPADREKTKPSFSNEDFVIFGVPVYSGLMPIFCREYIEKVKGNGTPCAIVCVYGNRAFEDCLAEMEDLVTGNGFNVYAAGAFIGEHSFSDKIAGGRPDSSDIQKAERFGEQIAAKLTSGEAPLAYGIVPGNRPYKKRLPSAPHPGPSTNDSCVNCGICAENCPMGAIDRNCISKIDETKCIRCLRCVRICPMKAKEFTDDGFKKTVETCIKAFGMPRKEPELFI